MLQKFKSWLIRNKGIFIAVMFSSLLMTCHFFGRCSTKRERSQELSNLIAARDSVKQSIVIIEGLQYTVFQKNAIILTKDEAIKAGIIEQERLKKLHFKELITNADLSGTIKVLRDSLKLPLGTVFVTIKDTSGVSRDYVRIPFTLLKIDEKYLSLNAGMNVDRTAWFKLQVPISGEMSIGYVKSGFLKSKPVGIFTSLNPYLTINNMDILIIKEPKKFYQKTWFHMVAGIAVFETGRYFLIK